MRSSLGSLQSEHDGVMTWKAFSITGPLCGESTSDQFSFTPQRTNYDVYFFSSQNKLFNKVHGATSSPIPDAMSSILPGVCPGTNTVLVNSLTPGFCVWNFLCVIAVSDLLSISIETALMWMPNDLTDCTSTLSVCLRVSQFSQLSFINIWGYMPSAYPILLWSW